MSARLTLNFMGSLQFYLDEARVTAERWKALAQLAFLALEGGKQTRDSLNPFLSPHCDQSRAFTNMRHTLWKVKQAIGEGWIIADREWMDLNPEGDISRDVRDFEFLLAQSRAQPTPSFRIPVLTDAVKLYRNHFLTGFSLKDAPGFNGWAFTRSEDLSHTLSTALTMLSEDHPWS